MLMPPNVALENLTPFNAIIFDLEGNLAWRSPRWAGPESEARVEARLIGLGWLEFIHHEDVGQLCEWLVTDHTEEAIAFRAMAPSTGKWVRLHWRKSRMGPDHWLVIGLREDMPRDEWPALPTGFIARAVSFTGLMMPVAAEWCGAGLAGG